MRGRGVTLRDVATAAGVHPSTASRALDPARSWRISDATVARVRAVSSAMGYTPDMVASGLKRGRQGTFGVIVASLEEPFIGLVVRGIADFLEGEKRVAFVAETHEDEARLAALVQHFVGRRVDAIVTTAARTRSVDLELAARRGTPVVLAVRSMAQTALPTVAGDDVLGITQAVEHLHALGHRVCAQLRGPADVSTFSIRARAFERRVAELGMRDVSIADTAEAVTIDAGRSLMARTLAEARPTAMIAHTDMLAVGAIDAARAAGLECPADISVVGYNDVPLAEYLSPPLTTVRIPALELGRRAAEIALRLIDDPETRPAPVLFPPELVVRRSTQPATKESRHAFEPAHVPA